MTKVCVACGYENESDDALKCPSCEKYYAKTENNHVQRINSRKSSGSALKVILFGAVCLIVGFFLGREHIKHEVRAKLQQVVEVLPDTAASELSPLPVIEKEQEKPKAKTSWKTTCASVADMAEQIMVSRQKGMPISALMDLLKGTELDGNGAIESLILEAYKKPRYSTEKHIERSVQDFKNEGYMDCVKDLR